MRGALLTFFKTMTLEMPLLTYSFVKIQMIIPTADPVFVRIRVPSKGSKSLVPPGCPVKLGFLFLEIFFQALSSLSELITAGWG